ncbi:branched-chain amino acid ABC transporter substrate-binding protein [Kitasatospora camelliae]|uniref:Branched-chain amino acid ABC transporter substrate-binding protein n=1 Tax=Kitasatospora camelliae TaxID=3156397 RepID=A0AAU8K3D4_9ACTN
MHHPHPPFRHARPGRAPALVLAGTLVLSGCSLVDSGGAGTELVIGVDIPLTSKFSAPAQGIRNSVEMAVAKANAKNLVPGVRFVLDVRDDSAEPKTAKAHAEAFAARPNVIGVVGPYNSAVALEMTPVLANAGIVNISPANTLPALTFGQDYLTKGKKRPYPTYFRTVTTDAVQGPYVARYALKKMKLDTVAVIDDSKAYGIGLADQMAGEFERGGGKVLMRESVPAGTTDFGALVQKIKTTKPKLVFFGGESTEAGPLSSQLKAAGVKVPVAGGDGVHKADYPGLAGGPQADGDLASSDGVAIDDLPSAYNFLEAYRAGKYTEPPGTFGPYGYDSVWALMLAVGKVVQDNKGKVPTGDLRAKVAKAVQDTSFFGVTGDVAFDEFGDSSNQIVSLYQVRNGKWETVVSSGKLNQLN